MTPSRDANLAETKPPMILTLLRWLTMRIPPIPHASGLSNRIVKPIWCHFTKEPVVLPVWAGTKMLLHPTDTLGGNLMFIPQLWDRWERTYARKCLKPGSVFVDLGANIGAYSLWTAETVGPKGRVIAIEADPETADVLRKNIALNNMEPAITVCQVGVSDRDETLRIERPCEGNMGITRLIADEQGNGPEIVCRTLAAILKSANVERVDLMKIDIEGAESKVLKEFFQATQSEPHLRPTQLLIEFDEGPLPAAEKEALAELIISNGYEMIHTGANAAFRRTDCPSA